MQGGEAAASSAMQMQAAAGKADMRLRKQGNSHRHVLQHLPHLRVDVPLH